MSSDERPVLAPETGPKFIGLDIGGTSVKGGLVQDGVILYSKVYALTDRTQETVLQTLVDACNDIMKTMDVSLQDVMSIGLCAPGLIDSANGIIIKAANFPTFDHVPICQLLTASLGLPCCIENDGNAAVLGEWWGASQDSTDTSAKPSTVCLLTLGTGVGGGIISNGSVLRGRMVAEIGHMICDIRDDAIPCPCGQNGCVERYVSANGIMNMVQTSLLDLATSLENRLDVDESKESVDPEILRKFAQDPVLNCETFFAFVPQNPAPRNLFTGYEDIDIGHWQMISDVFQRVFDRVISILATVCLNVARVVDADVFYIGGGVSHAGEFLMEAITSHYRSITWKFDSSDSPRIIMARQGNNAGLIGAARSSYDAFHKP